MVKIFNKNFGAANRLARKLRHQKLFGSTRSELIDFSNRLIVFISDSWKKRTRILKPRLCPVMVDDSVSTGMYCSKSLLKRVSLLVVLLFVLNSFNVNPAYTYYGNEEEFGVSSDQEENIQNLTGFITDEEGFMMKSVPISQNGNYLNRSDLVVYHKVTEGQTLSQIAEMYGLKTDTIKWANGISNANLLRLGMNLKIPKDNGVLYTVEKGDTIEKIAKKFNIESNKIKDKNEIKDDIVALNSVIIIPDAKPLEPPKPRYIAVARSGREMNDYVPSKPGNKEDIASGTFVFPTKGVLTQRYHSGHYAVDIANSSGNVVIYAIADGEVAKVATGTYGGGYGNHLIINHGDIGGKKFTSLYGHLKTVYVEVGQKVSKGEAVGIMGSTGRSTGPHLHLEIMEDGVKKNPYNYF